MENRPFFSIGIPVYNTEKYMHRCMDSIYSQSFTDYEIILVDDGSTDASGQILDDYAAKDSRVKVIHRENGGLPAARNCALYNSTGRYIFFLDSDDTICEEVLAAAHAAICENDYPDLLHTGFIRVTDGVETPVPVKPFGKEYFDPSFSKDERWIKMWLSKNSVDQVMTKFIRRDFLETAGISFATRLFAQEDSDFTFNICRKADTMAYADIYSFRYFKNRSDSLSTEWSYKSVASVLSRWSEFYYDIQFYKLSDETRRQLALEKANLVRQLRDATLGIASNRPKEECFRLIDLLDGYFGRDIRLLPVNGGGINRFIFRLYKLLGLKAAYKLLYTYLEMKGAVLKR